MTKNQVFLLEAARDLIAALDERDRGLCGPYRELHASRMVTAAIEAVEAEHDKAQDADRDADDYARATHAPYGEARCQ